MLSSLFAVSAVLPDAVIAVHHCDLRGSDCRLCSFRDGGFYNRPSQHVSQRAHYRWSFEAVSPGVPQGKQRRHRIAAGSRRPHDPLNTRPPPALDIGDAARQNLLSVHAPGLDSRTFSTMHAVTHHAPGRLRALLHPVPQPQSRAVLTEPCPSERLNTLALQRSSPRRHLTSEH